MSNNRRRLTGVVTRAKAEKTVMVRVDRSYRHPLYKKVIRTNKNYMVHDELGVQLGDEVTIVESRPISKNKHWAIESVVRAARAGRVEGEEDLVLDAPEIETEASE